MKKSKLDDAVFFSNKRGKLKDLRIDSYITTDNLLPNRSGITTATGLPPKGDSFPKYSNNDILISNIRPYLQKIWFSNKEGICSSDVLCLTTKTGFTPKFVYYCLSRNEFFEHMMKGSKGTKMPRGDKRQILEFEIPQFSINIQQQIANLLSALDAKITLNNKLNDNLLHQITSPLPARS